MRHAFGFALAALLIASGTTGAMAATRHGHHATQKYTTDRPGAVPIIPNGARGAFGSVVAPTVGQDCSLRPFARDCDKRGPW